MPLMLTSACPRCNEAIRLPTDHVPDDVQVTCPWCRESFAMAEINELLPPMLLLPKPPSGEVLLDVEGTDVGSWPNDAGLVLQDPGRPGGEFPPPPSDAFSPPDEFPADFAAASSGRGGAIAKSKGSGSPVKLLLQSLAGLILAIPLACLGLLALGSPPDFGFYPFNGRQTKQRAASSPMPPPHARPAVTPGRSLQTDLSLPATQPESMDDGGFNVDDDEIIKTYETQRQTIQSREADVVRAAAAAVATPSSAVQPISPAADDPAAAATPGPDPGVTEAVQAIDQLEAADRDNRATYWRNVVATYSKIAALATRPIVAAEQVDAVLARLDRSSRLDDLVSKTPVWLAVTPQQRAAQPLLNDGVILVGKVSGDVFTLRDGRQLTLVPRPAPPEPDRSVIALGRLLSSSGDTERVELVAWQAAKN